MSFREKFAWLSLIAMALTYGPYFTMVAVTDPPADTPNLGLLGLFAATTIVQMIILLSGRFILTLSAPQDARAPADERDRAIERRASLAAYYVLISGTVLAGVFMPFVTSGWRIVNVALAAIVAAEVVRYGLIAAGYRRSLA